jgi:hypothetical protein
VLLVNINFLIRVVLIPRLFVAGALPEEYSGGYHVRGQDASNFPEPSNTLVSTISPGMKLACVLIGTVQSIL